MNIPERILATVRLCSLMALVASCANQSPAAVNTDSTACTVRAILRLKEPGAATDIEVLNKVAEIQQLQFDSVTQLGDGLYRVLVRSQGQNCATVLTRLNADPRIAYAGIDERKRVR